MLCPHQWKSHTLSLICLLVYLAGSSYGAPSIILEIEGLEEALEVESVSWGVKNESAPMDPKPPDFDDVGFASLLTRSSPELFKRTADGMHYPQAELRFYHQGQDKPFYQIELETVFVSSAKLKTSSTAAQQEVSLRYRKIRWTYYTFDADGEVDLVFQAGWDIQSNTEW